MRATSLSTTNAAPASATTAQKESPINEPIPTMKERQKPPARPRRTASAVTGPGGAANARPSVVAEKKSPIMSSSQRKAQSAGSFLAGVSAGATSAASECRSPLSGASGQQACKPDSVKCDHPSRPSIPRRLEQRTRPLGGQPRTGPVRLAPDGVWQAVVSPRRWWALTPPFHPYHRRLRRVLSPLAVSFLCHFPSAFAAWDFPSVLPCGVRTFLEPESSRSPGLHSNCTRALCSRPALRTNGRVSRARQRRSLPRSKPSPRRPRRSHPDEHSQRLPNAPPNQVAEDRSACRRRLRPPPGQRQAAGKVAPRQTPSSRRELRPRRSARPRTSPQHQLPPAR